MSRLLSTLFACAAAEPLMRPNLMFMMCDQLRWDAQGYASPGFQNTSVRTPALDRIAAEGVRLSSSWSSTPTCTPARAALLTGRRPWGHGMLGYGKIAPHYPLTFPHALASAGYATTSLGKDHFGWNATTDAGIAHGYQKTDLYDGLGHWNASEPHSWTEEYDDYDRWFQSQLPGKDPQATLDKQDEPNYNDGWNGWHGRAYVYDEKLHPTAWVGARADGFLRAAPTEPFLLKVSFHRPHSPYDPPQRLLDLIKADELPPMARCAATQARPGGELIPAGGDWCLRYRGNTSAGDPPGCGWGHFACCWGCCALATGGHGVGGCW